MDGIYDQIFQHIASKNNCFLNRRLKTILVEFTLNYVDVDDQYYIFDKKYLQVLQELHEKIVIVNLIEERAL